MIETPKIDCDFVYEICKRHFEKANIVLRFPKNTPPHLTYQWRSIKSVTKKFQEWNFTPSEIDLFIGVAISKSDQFRIKGLNILNDSDILDKCYEEVKNLDAIENQDITLLRHSHQWLYKQLRGAPAVDHLISRRKPGALTNIVTYYQSGLLIKLYLAFSKPCCVALELLSQRCPEERKLCPNNATLHYTRRYQHQEIIPQIREIFGSDLYV